MSTKNQFKGALAICQRQWVKRSPQNQNLWLTRRTSAAILAGALVLPAIAPIIDAPSLRSLALILVGLFFLIGFGVPYYILLRWCLEANAASESETALELAALKTSAVSHVIQSLEDKRMADRVRLFGEKAA